MGEDGKALSAAMAEFAERRSLSEPVAAGQPVDEAFVAGVGDSQTTLETIRRYHRDHHYLLDPHTAVGVHVAEPLVRDGEPMICLATAHPAKFGDAIRDAIGEPAHHPVLDGLDHAPTRCHNVARDRQEICRYIAEHAL
jgi:threonine synthase